MTTRLRAIITRGDQDTDVVGAFGQFRKRLFINQLKWPLRSFRNEEVDQFDSDDAIYCVIFFEQKVVGGFRALPTDGAYLARAIFPQLASDRPYPASSDVWEISRFGIAAGTHSSGTLSRLNYGLMFRFAQRRQLRALVAIADLTYERYLHAIGIRTTRYGQPQSIRSDGSTPVDIVAGEIPIATQTPACLQKLTSALNTVEIIDETLVFGRSRISA